MHYPIIDSIFIAAYYKKYARSKEKSIKISKNSFMNKTVQNKLK